jgi:hypothetical protein
MEINVKLNIWVNETDLIKLGQEQINYTHSRIFAEQIQIEISLDTYQKLIKDELLKKIQLL